MSVKSILTGLLALIIHVSNARIYESASSIPDLNGYDYVIIGGGLSGLVLANRLTESPGKNALVLESGGSHEGVFIIEVPGLQSFTGIGTQYNWNYSTIVQTTLANRTLPAPRGHVLGGSTSVHGMWWTRGSSADFDRWAAVTGDNGWAWNNLLPYFKKSEIIVPPADGHNITGQYNPALHGTTGPLAVTVGGYSDVPLDNLISGRLEAQFPFKFIQDYQNGEPLGVGYTQTTILKGARSSSATAYLDPILSRPNLDILINARALKVVRSSGNVITTVLFEQEGRSAPIRNVTAKTEVILSAGVINTPQLLLNSGIGDKSVLAALKIPLVHNLPSVGKNMTEHPAIPVTWNTKIAVSDPETAFEAAVAQWNSTRTGRLVMAVANHVGWFRMNESDPTVAAIIKEFGDPAPGPKSPHIELLPTMSAFTAEQNFANAMFVVDAVNLTPLSRGSVSLDPSNPFGPPLIDYNFYSEPQDIQVIRQAIRTAIALVSTPEWEEVLGTPSDDFAPVITAIQNNQSDVDEVMDTYIRATTTIGFHVVGTCSMSPKGASWGVVDPDFHVKGVSGLRVVDSSIFPFVPAAHTQAAVYAVVERAADIIKGVISPSI